MAFGRKRNKKHDVDIQDEEVRQPKKAKRRHKGNSVADIIQESVPEAVIDAMKSNDSFLVYKDGETLYVGLLLNFDQIGGLGKKARKDEEKGRMIECINSGKILCLATEDLLSNNSIIIVPNITTLDAMGDFPLLTASDLNYRLVGLDDTAHVEDLAINISYDEVIDIIQDEDATIMDLAISLNAPWALEAANELADDSQDASVDVTQQFSTEPDYVSDINPSDFGVAQDGAGASAEPVSDGGVQHPQGAHYAQQPQPQQQPQEQPYTQYEESVQYTTPQGETVDEYGQYQQYQDGQGQQVIEEDISVDEYPTDEITATVTADDVSDTVSRLFYNDDLGIEVTTEPFEAHFVRSNPFVPIETPPEGWLNGYVGEMVREANGEFERRHQQNLLKAKNIYLTLVSQFCNEIRDDLDYQDTSTRYGALSQRLQQHRADLRDDVDRRVAQRKSELTQEWQEALDRAGQEAAASARRSYEERNGRLHAKQLSEVDREMRDEVESEYQDDMRELHNRRRAEAQARLQQVMSLVIAEVSKSYMKDLEEEQAEYKRFRNQMAEFVESARQDEIAHDKVMAEELRQTDKADNVMRDYQQRLEQTESHARAEAERLRGEIADMQRRTATQIDAKDEEVEKRVRDLQLEKDALQSRLDSVMNEYSKLDESKSREWKSRVNTLTQERDRWAEEAGQLLISTKRSGWQAFLIAGIGIIAALAVGFLLGMLLNFSQPNTAGADVTSSPVTSTYDSYSSYDSTYSDGGSAYSSGVSYETPNQTNQQ